MEDSESVEVADEVLPWEVWKDEGGSRRVAAEVVDEDKGDVEEGEDVCVSDAEEVNFGGLDEEAAGSGEF